jgi:hypothetical protein
VDLVIERQPCLGLATAALKARDPSASEPRLREPWCAGAPRPRAGTPGPHPRRSTTLSSPSHITHRRYRPRRRTRRRPATRTMTDPRRSAHAPFQSRQSQPTEGPSGSLGHRRATNRRHGGRYRLTRHAKPTAATARCPSLSSWWEILHSWIETRGLHPADCCLGRDSKA